MKTIWMLTTVLIPVFITFLSINCSNDHVQAESATALKAATELQSDKQAFVALTEAKIAAIRRSLEEMEALAAHASPPTRIEINKHSERMKKHIEAAEKNLAGLKASNNPAFN